MDPILDFIQLSRYLFYVAPLILRKGCLMQMLDRLAISPILVFSLQLYNPLVYLPQPFSNIYHAFLDLLTLHVICDSSQVMLYYLILLGYNLIHRLTNLWYSNLNFSVTLIITLDYLCHRFCHLFLSCIIFFFHQPLNILNYLNGHHLASWHKHLP